uniref:DUF4005 domain-containing protein n=1 Tax=Setaria digitata TaxID=48799 RepID=A0A915PH63_9BILA
MLRIRAKGSVIYRGKPEWQKIGNVERCTTNNCCLHNPKVQSDISSSGNPMPAKNIQIVDKQQSDTRKADVSWRRDKQQTTTTTITTPSPPPPPSPPSPQPQPITVSSPSTITIFQIFQRKNAYQQLSEQYVNKVARAFQYLCSAFYSILKCICTIMMNIIIWFYSKIYDWFASGEHLTKTPGTSTTTFIKNQKEIEEVNSETIANKIQSELQQQQQQQQSSSIDSTMNFQIWSSPSQKAPIQPVEFYSKKEIYTRNFDELTSEGSDATTSVVSPSAPASLSLPVFQAVTATATTIKDDEKIPPKGGVAVLPPDIMAEAHARVREREQKLNEQKVELQENNEMNSDWTVTSKRFVPLKWKMSTSKVDEGPLSDSKINEDESEIMKPTGRSVVSRISQSSDQDAQFIFRPPKHQNIPANRLVDGNFLMGRSVFSPVREAEEMRDRLNRRMTETPSESLLGSRLNTPLEDFYTTSHINTPFDVATQDSHTDLYSGYPTNRSRSQSRIQATFSPPSFNKTPSPRRDEQGISMLRQRSKTVEPRIVEGTVKALTRKIM